MKNKGWINDAQRDNIQDECRQTVLTAMKSAEAAKKPSLEHAFTDVYDVPPKRLQEQRQELMDHLKKHGEHYHLDQFSDKL